MLFFSWNKSKETRQRKQNNKNKKAKQKDSKKENKEGRKKENNKRERERVRRGEGKNYGETKDTLKNKQKCPCLGENSFFF